MHAIANPSAMISRATTASRKTNFEVQCGSVALSCCKRVNNPAMVVPKTLDEALSNPAQQQESL